LSLGLVRIPDVAVFEGNPPDQEVPETPPLVVVEITSPDDRLSQSMERLEEFRRWGVRHIWVIDPLLRRLFVYHEGSLSAVEVLELLGYPLTLTPSEVF